MEIKQFSAIIIDDEEEAQNIVERLLLRLGNISVKGKAGSVDSGINLVMEHKPDLIFLDVQMPGKNGFELIKSLKKFNLKTTVIFVTAHHEYAINAMKVAAFDYLLKPVVFKELEDSIQRYREKQQESLNEKKVDKLLDILDKSGKISFNTRTGYIYVAPGDIVYCCADINYTEILFSLNRKEVVTLNIGKVEEMLDNPKFYRISRSHLINTDFLVKADRKTKTCELFKDNDKFIVPAPPKQIRLLEKLIHSNGLI
ncbi:MAG: LytTR family DNA-binding domain-containing protein [Bacteroidales bacterium]|nr:LytTR family DNA-binding domain-containing protein [Bacteroidales bacterium]